MNNFILYTITTLIFFAIDMVWLGLIAKNFYRQKLGFILSPEVNWIAAIVFYLIYIGGILFFYGYSCHKRNKLANSFT